jgi:hypothetical protein
MQFQLPCQSQAATSASTSHFIGLIFLDQLMKIKIFLPVLIAALGLANGTYAQTRSSSLSTSASPSATASVTPSVSPAKQTNRPIPFHGMVSGVDQKARTFSITGKGASRVFKVTDRTVITKGAGNATMKEIVDNEEVIGAYWKNPDGTLEAKMVRIGPMEKPKLSPSPKPSASPAKS